MRLPFIITPAIPAKKRGNRFLFIPHRVKLAVTAIITLTSMLLTTYSCAETCPTVYEIKHNALHGWAAYDSDNGLPLNQAALHTFQTNLYQFTMAEWADEAPEGSSHCYYLNHDGNYMDAFLATHDLKADISSAAWKQVGGFLRCDHSIDVCRFV